MKLNLNELYPEQDKLDKYIGKTKGIKMEDYKQERIIALQVEFNELLNELPFIFKYWSNKKMDRAKALEEYVDGWHFILSIGNDYGITEHVYTERNVHDIRVLVRGINNIISRLDKKDYPVLVDYYILLGEKLNFSEEEVIVAYHSKNETNHARQEDGY